MVADWHDGFVLRSEWIPGAEPQTGCYRLTLTNRSKAAISGFRLGISGPARVNEAAKPTNAMVVTQLSNYAELAPPAGFTLAPGADWQIELDRLDYQGWVGCEYRPRASTDAGLRWIEALGTAL